jgi:hypothetical protein
MESKAPKKKPYSPPTLTKLTPEQAKKLVADRKNCSEEEAADLLEMPPDNGNQNTATDQRRKRSA